VFFLFDLDKDAHEARDLAGNRKLLAPMMKLFLDKRASVHEVRTVP
jgi:hypothetical protein